MKRHVSRMAIVGALALTASDGEAAARESFLGEVMWTAGQYCPVDWAEANGAMVSIAQNSALYAVIGTAFGGDGKATFSLPDLRGRSPVGQGAGPGLQPRMQGQQIGAEGVILSPSNLGLSGGVSGAGGSSSTASAVAANAARTAVPTVSPALVLRPCISLRGEFPTRQ